MNLLPQDAFHGRAGSRWRTPASALPAMAGCVLVAGSVVLAFLDMGRLDSRHRAEVATATRLEAQIAEFEGLRDRIEEDRRRIGQLRVVEGRLARWDEERHVLPDLLRELPLTVGDGVVLENLRRRGDDFRITGRTGSTGSARTAAGRFRKMDRVRSLTLEYVERDADGRESGRGLGDHRFSLTGTLRFNSRDPGPPAALLTAFTGGGGNP